MPYETRAIRSFSAVRKQPVAKRSLEVKRRHIRNVAMLIAIVITCALLFVWTRVRVIQLGYDVSKLRKEASELREQKNILEGHVASLKAPKRLSDVAKERFNMRLPMGGEIVFVEPKGEVIKNN